MHKGHHQRGYLPHRDYQDSLQSITFREAGSLPKEIVTAWKDELSQSLSSPDTTISAKAQRTLRQRIDRYEDAGHGPCHLKTKPIAGLVQSALISGHTDQYQLLAWCIMPNHVHVLIKLTSSQALGKIVQQWKGGTSIEINRILSRKGTFWAPDYHDRAIRDEDHYWNTIRYIHHNPVKAGLVASPEDWPYSSASTPGPWSNPA